MIECSTDTIVDEMVRMSTMFGGMPSGPKNDRRIVREFYRRALPEIKCFPANVWAIDPYAWSDYIALTPIEEALWNDIRHHGIVAYPQFPVGPFFVDFGNPVARIAIECDGAKWHSTPEQLDRDSDRQAELELAGWRVFRLSGRECHALDLEEEDSDTGEINFIPGPASRLMHQLRGMGIAA